MLTVALAGCGSVAITPGTGAPAAGGPGSSGGGPPTGCLPPAVCGTPPAATLAGRTFSFQPAVNAAGGGNAPQFSITGQPAWASFDPVTGALTGKPGAADVGSYTITITATKGSGTAPLRFTLEVLAAAAGRATVSWIAPMQRTDGSTLQNLAGFRVYYGTAGGALYYVLDVATPGASSVVVDNLTTGTWYFAATAFDRNGVESARSGLASKTI